MTDYRDIHNISFTAYALLSSMGYSNYTSALDVEERLIPLVEHARQGVLSVRSGGLCVTPEEEGFRISVEVGEVRRD